MKRILCSLAVIALITSCNNAPNADKATTGEKETAAILDGTNFVIDTTTSTVTWQGTKPTGAHIGTFKLKDGTLAQKEGVLTSGNFTINIASLNNLDLAGDTANKPKLEGHLKSADFFDAAKYPTATFSITAVEPFKYDSTTMKNVILKNATHTIRGNLTLKDSTKNIAFPAVINITNNKITADADFNIDRTIWGLNYKGPNNPADWFIRKEVNIKLKISATKK